MYIIQLYYKWLLTFVIVSVFKFIQIVNLLIQALAFNLYFFLVGYTYARSPWIYCSQVESPPEFFITIYENRLRGIYPNQQYNGSPESSAHGITPITYEFFEKSASSSGLRVDDGQYQNLDLNHSPPDEHDLNLKLWRLILCFVIKLINYDILAHKCKNNGFLKIKIIP